MDLLHTQLAALQHRLSFVATDPIDWKFYVQACSWAVTLFESYLLSVPLPSLSFFFSVLTSINRLRQYPLYSKTAPPPVLAGHFDEATFRKSQLYGRDKAQFSLVTGLLKQAIDSAMLHYGFYAWAWNVGGRLVGRLGYGAEYEVSATESFRSDTSPVPTHGHPRAQITQSLAFAAILFVFSSAISTPLSVYQTFVLEEKHGFNKTSPNLFVTDLVKGWLLAFAIGGPFLAVFLYVFKWAGGRFVPWLMAFLWVPLCDCLSVGCLRLCIGSRFRSSWSSCTRPSFNPCSTSSPRCLQAIYARGPRCWRANSSFH